jgi:hypothetical protein
MAIHSSIPSMLQESLVEIFLVARDCINFRKDPKIWGSCGCYGYPAAILLFVIADGIGSYVIDGNTRQHFDILNHKNYYNLNLDKKSIDIIYEKYRCLLTHNAVLANNTVLDIGNDNLPVFNIQDNVCYIYLKPFLEITKVALGKFLLDVKPIVENSKQLQEILKK